MAVHNDCSACFSFKNISVIANCNRSDSVWIDILSFVSGTNVDAARDILDKSGLAITTGDNFEDAAIKAVASLK